MSQNFTSLCTNNMEFDGVVYGQFECPVEGIFKLYLNIIKAKLI